MQSFVYIRSYAFPYVHILSFYTCLQMSSLRMLKIHGPKWLPIWKVNPSIYRYVLYIYSSFSSTLTIYEKVYNCCLHAVRSRYKKRLPISYHNWFVRAHIDALFSALGLEQIKCISAFLTGSMPLWFRRSVWRFFLYIVIIFKRKGTKCSIIVLFLKKREISLHTPVIY